MSRRLRGACIYAGAPNCTLTVRQQTLRISYTKGRYLASVDSSSERRSIYRRGQTGSKATVYEQEKAEAALSHIGLAGCASRASGGPLERICDPQISPTGQMFYWRVLSILRLEIDIP